MVSLADYLAHFERRIMIDAALEASRSYWLRRAEDFERAKPVEPPGGFKYPEQAREQWRRCHALAKACRNAAEVAPVQDIADALDAVLGDVA